MAADVHSVHKRTQRNRRMMYIVSVTGGLVKLQRWGGDTSKNYGGSTLRIQINGTWKSLKCLLKKLIAREKSFAILLGRLINQVNDHQNAE